MQDIRAKVPWVYRFKGKTRKEGYAKAKAEVLKILEDQHRETVQREAAKRSKR